MPRSLERIGGERYPSTLFVGIEATPIDGDSRRPETAQGPENERLVVENKAGIPSIFTWTFAPHESGTTLNMEVDYTIPVPVLGKLAEAVVLKRNEREADLWMQNIKEAVEAQQ